MVIGILCLYLVFLFIDSKRRPVELSITADEVRRFGVIEGTLMSMKAKNAMGLLQLSNHVVQKLRWPFTWDLFTPH